MDYRPGPGVGDGQATDSTVYAVCLVLSEVKHMISVKPSLTTVIALYRVGHDHWFMLAFLSVQFFSFFGRAILMRLDPKTP